eukprot:CAMPEP_0204303552 /NCGR_PEP_ID=MMETSP0468-20130131/83967_1 /ASSEMBLY_ACC=CAM_ASM_000383 /TAXON_ID=2969 /ORGANISM="Oxyrrhis marina" /LENGTH=274 /DNA_ID=CAMNT_0051282865 /DNA_START=77 /DNA_END=901 /DNA_ORIENTATION=+
MRVSLLAVFAVASLAGQQEMTLSAERYDGEEVDRDVDDDTDADVDGARDGAEDADPQDDDNDESGAEDGDEDVDAPADDAPEDAPADDTQAEDASEDAPAEDAQAEDASENAPAEDDSADDEDGDIEDVGDGDTPESDRDIEDVGDGDAPESDKEEAGASVEQDVAAGNVAKAVGDLGAGAAKVSNATAAVVDVAGGEDDSELGLSADDKVIEKEAAEKAEQDAEKVLKNERSAPAGGTGGTEFPIKLDPSLKDAEVRHETEEFDMSLQQRLRR